MQECWISRESWDKLTALLPCRWPEWHSWSSKTSPWTLVKNLQSCIFFALVRGSIIIVLLMLFIKISTWCHFTDYSQLGYHLSWLIHGNWRLTGSTVTYKMIVLITLVYFVSWTWLYHLTKSDSLKKSLGFNELSFKIFTTYLYLF